MRKQNRFTAALDGSHHNWHSFVRLSLRWAAAVQVVSVVFLILWGVLVSRAWAAKGQAVRHPAQGYTIYVVPHSHMDLEWQWTYDTGQVLAIRVLDQVLEMLKKDPNFAFSQDQMLALKLFWEALSDADRIFLRRMVREGRFEVTGGMYVHPEVNEPDFESLSRQFLFAKPWMEKTFETKIVTAWNLDTFGNTIQMPQLFRRAGFRYFPFMRDMLPSLEASVKSPFYWQSPDGSKVLAYWLSGSYGIDPDRPGRRLERIIEHNVEGNDKIIVFWGSDWYMPIHTSQDIERRMRRAAAELGIPVKSVVVSTARRYFEDIEKSGISLPTYTYDFNPPLFIQDLRGIWGERPRQKLAERRAEDMLESSEKFNSIASLYGQPYPAGELLGAWEKVLINHNHDNVGGSQADSVDQAIMSRYGGAIEAGRATLAEALYRLSRKVDTSQGGNFPFLVFNALSYPRTEVVRHAPSLGAGREAFRYLSYPRTEVVPQVQTKNFRILDEAGNPVPFRLVAAYQRREGDPLSMAVVEFLAEIPALGYRLYRIEAVPGTAEPSVWRPAGNEIANRFFRLRLDPATGVISSLVDRRSGEELLDTSRYGGNELVLLEEKDPNMEGMVYFTGTEIRGSKFPPDAISEMEDDLGTRVRIEGPFLTGRRRQEITLYHQLPRIDFKTELLGFPGHDGMLTAVFPLRRRGELRNKYETHNAVTERPEGMYYASTWVDVGNAEGRVAFLNQGMAGHIIEKGIVKLILLRSVTNYRFYDSPRAAEAGSHSFEYSLYPHQGDWSSSGVMEQAHSFNSPLRVISTDSHKGSLPAKHSFLEVESGHFEVTALKKAEEGRDLILRGHENQGKAGRVGIRLALPVQQVWRADLLEQPGKELAISQGKVQFDCQPFEFVTLRLRLKE